MSKTSLLLLLLLVPRARAASVVYDLRAGACATELDGGIRVANRSGRELLLRPSRRGLMVKFDGKFVWGGAMDVDKIITFSREVPNGTRTDEVIYAFVQNRHYLILYRLLQTSRDESHARVEEVIGYKIDDLEAYVIDRSVAGLRAPAIVITSGDEFALFELVDGELRRAQKQNTSAPIQELIVSNGDRGARVTLRPGGERFDLRATPDGRPVLVPARP